MEAASEGTSVKVIQYGLLMDPFLNFTAGELLFVLDDGTISETAPQSGYQTRLGRAVETGVMLVLIEAPVTL